MTLNIFWGVPIGLVMLGVWYLSLVRVRRFFSQSQAKIDSDMSEMGIIKMIGGTIMVLYFIAGAVLLALFTLGGIFLFIADMAKKSDTEKAAEHYLRNLR